MFYTVSATKSFNKQHKSVWIQYFRFLKISHKSRSSTWTCSLKNRCPRNFKQLHVPHPKMSTTLSAFAMILLKCKLHRKLLPVTSRCSKLTQYDTTSNRDWLVMFEQPCSWRWRNSGHRLAIVCSPLFVSFSHPFKFILSTITQTVGVL